MEKTESGSPGSGRDFQGWFMSKLPTRYSEGKKSLIFPPEFLITFYETSLLPTRRLVHGRIKRESGCLAWQNLSDLSALRRGGILGWCVPGLQGLEAPGHSPLLPASLPPRAGWAGWAGQRMAEIIGVFRQPAAGGSLLRLLTCLWGWAGFAGTCWAGLEAVITGAL